MPILRTDHLTKIYGNRVIAVNGVSLRVEQGQVFGLLGPNGAGKTTLLKLLLGLQVPTAGRAEVFGGRMAPHAAHLRQRIGYLPTNPKFPPAMTPITYLDFAGELFGMPREQRKPRLASLIRAMDLLPAASQPIKSFSTGMTSRPGIAASLINDPDLLIWDEPTAGLDPAGSVGSDRSEGRERRRRGSRSPGEAALAQGGSRRAEAAARGLLCGDRHQPQGGLLPPGARQGSRGREELRHREPPRQDGEGAVRRR